MKRFVSVGECMIEMVGKAGGPYRLGYAGDTFSTAWSARARLRPDWAVDYVTALGTDAQSDRMAAFFATNGIGTGHIQRLAERQPGLRVIEEAGGGRQISEWRGQSAARAMADAPGVLNAALAGADMVFFSGTSMAILGARGRGKLIAALYGAREAGGLIAFDPNEDAMLWTSPQIMASALTTAASVADIVLVRFAGEAATFGDTSAEATAARYLALGASEIVVRNGTGPALVASATAAEWVAAPGAAGTEADGDSFNGAYLAARAEGAGPVEAARVATNGVK